MKLFTDSCDFSLKFGVIFFICLIDFHDLSAKKRKPEASLGLRYTVFGVFFYDTKLAISGRTSDLGAQYKSAKFRFTPIRLSVPIISRYSVFDVFLSKQIRLFASIVWLLTYP